MKRMVISALALLMVAGTADAQRRSREGRELDAEERRELRERLQELRREMRELQRRLGEGYLLGSVEPLVFSLTGNRARLGVIVDTDRDAEANAIGAELEAVTPDGPADEAGLQAGDIVISLNGEAVTDTRRRQTPGDRLVELARALQVGDTARIEYERDGERHTATVVAARRAGFSFDYSVPSLGLDSSLRVYAGELAGRARDLSDRVRVRSFGEGGPWVLAFGNSRWADMELTTLDAELGSYFGTEDGLLVVRAPRDDLLQLRSGDVIRRIGGRSPANPSHALRILRSYEPGDEIRIDIMWNQQRTTVTATVPERDRGLFWDQER